MKEIRKYGAYKYSIELEPVVSYTINAAERSSDIKWEFHIDLIDYPGGLSNDMARGILNFIGEMEKEYLKSKMKSAIDNLIPDTWAYTGLTHGYKPAKDLPPVIFDDERKSTFTSEIKD